MKKIIAIAIVLICLFVQANTVVAEDDERELSFSSSVINKGESILFDISDDYANQTPKVKLDCKIEDAAVYAPDGSLVRSVLTDDTIIFNVNKGGGTYIIQKVKPSPDSDSSKSSGGSSSKTYKIPKTGIEE